MQFKALKNGVMTRVFVGYKKSPYFLGKKSVQSEKSI